MLSHVDVLRRNASAYGPRVAITSADGVDLTYAELDRVTNALANSLVDAGNRPGDRLVWLDRNSADFLVAYFATAKAGMTFTPLNAWLRARELAPQLELLQPSVVVAGPEFCDTVEQACAGLDVKARFIRPDTGEEEPVRAGWGSWAAFAGLGSPDAPPAVDNDEDRIHEIVFTSGTTGQAKGVMRSQRGRILDSVYAALGYELTREDHLLTVLPQFHIGGGAVPNQLLVQGGRVSILRRYEPLAMAQGIANGATYIVGVPAHYALLFESGHLDGVDTSRVRGCYVGGSAASPTLFEAIRRHFPAAELVHGYGSTESGPHTLALRGQAFLDHFGSLGLPVAGSEVRVVDDSGAEAGVGEVGELWVRSDSVMAGYLGRPDLTEAAFAPGGWLKTGDLVRRSADGYFSLVDRAKDMIISGGENVYPREVEDIIAGFPGVSEVAVIGLPDPVYEERVVAVIRVSDPTVTTREAELIAFVRERMAGFKVPKQVYFVDDLPRTGAGKIAKPVLRATYAPASAS